MTPRNPATTESVITRSNEKNSKELKLFELASKATEAHYYKEIAKKQKFDLLSVPVFFGIKCQSSYQIHNQQHTLYLTL